mgnify:CR=1 FL=1
MIKIQTTEEMLEFIKILRESDKYIRTIFMQGSCYRFHLILKQFADCEPAINKDKNHIATYFKGKYYDITGEAEGEYFPLTKADLKKCKNWSFYRTMLLKLGECDICEEPIIV